MTDPEMLSSTAPDESTVLTRGEFLSMLALGLAIAAIATGVALFTGKPQPATTSNSTTMDKPRALTSFNLIERSGRPVTQAELAGRFLVVNFVFTSCSLSCRAVNDRMAEIQTLAADVPDIRLVSLTVDPRSDTPSALTTFANSFRADTNRWLFLTGDKVEVYRVIETSFIPKSPELEQIIPGGFTSTDRILLVDPAGNVFASFNGLNKAVAPAIVQEIARRRKAI